MTRGGGGWGECAHREKLLACLLTKNYAVGLYIFSTLVIKNLFGLDIAILLWNKMYS